MSEIFKIFDKKFNHTLVHTGQHFDKLLSGIFFKDLNIRKPDYNLKISSKNSLHYHQLSKLNIKFLDLIKKKKLKPDLIVFLGDSNSVGLSFVLKKEGYKIAHIEAGMRSYDNRMLEEINRVVCDKCSDFLFVYHKDYKENLLKENIKKNVFVVGNTIIEPCKKILSKITKKPLINQKYILVDIHRPENFLFKKRLENIIEYCSFVKKKFKSKILFLKFKRTMIQLKKFKINTSELNLIPLQGYKNYLSLQRDSFFILSDSGTAQEEPSIFKKPVIVPRDYTERPQSYKYNCSFKINVNNKNKSWNNSVLWINKLSDKKIKSNKEWLGDGTTSSQIAKILELKL
jgi:UDP-N-acetylglucosamine 2-epimerase (non-hydrolysing)